MGPGFYVIAILGCADGSAACTPVATMPTRYESRDACVAATGADACRQWRIRLPDAARPMPPGQGAGRRPRARPRSRRRAPGLSVMADTDTEPMIHEDALPGAESEARAQARLGAALPRVRTGSRTRSPSSPAPTAASAGRSPRSMPAKAPTSPSSICASMRMPRRPRRSSRREGRRAILVPGDLGDPDFAPQGGAEGGRHVRPARHPGQQCRRAACRQGHPRHHRRAAAAHLPDQHLLDVLPGPGGAGRTSRRVRRSSTAPR